MTKIHRWAMFLAAILLPSGVFSQGGGGVNPETAPGGGPQPQGPVNPAPGTPANPSGAPGVGDTAPGTNPSGGTQAPASTGGTSTGSPSIPQTDTRDAVSGQERRTGEQRKDRKERKRRGRPARQAPVTPQDTGEGNVNRMTDPRAP